MLSLVPNAFAQNGDNSKGYVTDLDYNGGGGGWTGGPQPMNYYSAMRLSLYFFEGAETREVGEKAEGKKTIVDVIADGTWQKMGESIDLELEKKEGTYVDTSSNVRYTTKNVFEYMADYYNDGSYHLGIDYSERYDSDGNQKVMPIYDTNTQNYDTYQRRTFDTLVDNSGEKLLRPYSVDGDPIPRVITDTSKSAADFSIWLQGFEGSIPDDVKTEEDLYDRFKGINLINITALAEECLNKGRTTASGQQVKRGDEEYIELADHTKDYVFSIPRAEREKDNKDSTAYDEAIAYLKSNALVTGTYTDNNVTYSGVFQLYYEPVTIFMYNYNYYLFTVRDAISFFNFYDIKVGDADGAQSYSLSRSVAETIMAAGNAISLAYNEYSIRGYVDPEYNTIPVNENDVKANANTQNDLVNNLGVGVFTSFNGQGLTSIIPDIWETSYYVKVTGIDNKGNLILDTIPYTHEKATFAKYSSGNQSNLVVIEDTKNVTFDGVEYIAVLNDIVTYQDVCLPDFYTWVDVDLPSYTIYDAEDGVVNEENIYGTANNLAIAFAQKYAEDEFINYLSDATGVDIATIASLVVRNLSLRNLSGAYDTIFDVVVLENWVDQLDNISSEKKEEIKENLEPRTEGHTAYTAFINSVADFFYSEDSGIYTTQNTVRAGIVDNGKVVSAVHPEYVGKTNNTGDYKYVGDDYSGEAYIRQIALRYFVFPVPQQENIIVYKDENDTEIKRIVCEPFDLTVYESNTADVKPPVEGADYTLEEGQTIEFVDWALDYTTPLIDTFPSNKMETHTSTDGKGRYYIEDYPVDKLIPNLYVLWEIKQSSQIPQQENIIIYKDENGKEIERVSRNPFKLKMVGPTSAYVQPPVEGLDYELEDGDTIKFLDWALDENTPLQENGYFPNSSFKTPANSSTDGEEYYIENYPVDNKIPHLYVSWEITKKSTYTPLNTDVPEWRLTRYFGSTINKTGGTVRYASMSIPLGRDSGHATSYLTNVGPYSLYGSGILTGSYFKLRNANGTFTVDGNRKGVGTGNDEYIHSETFVFAKNGVLDTDNISHGSPNGKINLDAKITAIKDNKNGKADEKQKLIDSSLNDTDYACIIKCLHRVL